METSQAVRTSQSDNLYQNRAKCGNWEAEVQTSANGNCLLLKFITTLQVVQSQFLKMCYSKREVLQYMFLRLTEHD